MFGDLEDVRLGDGHEPLRRFVGAEAPVVAFEVADGELARAIFLIGQFHRHLRSGCCGTRVQRVRIAAACIHPSLSDPIAVLIFASAPEHDQVAAPAHLGVGNAAIVILVKGDGLKAKGILQPFCAALASLQRSRG